MTNISALSILAVLLLISLLSVTSARIKLNEHCQTPNSLPGLCIPLEQCPHLNNLNRKETLSYNETNFLQNSQCGLHRGNILVCCAPTRSRSLPAKLPEPGRCGYQKSYKIVGGTNTFIGEFPWLALLVYTNDKDEKIFKCGGSLINDRYVLTAAHCVTPSKKWLLTAVRLGEWDIRKDPDCDDTDTSFCADPHLDVPIEKIVKHENHISVRSTHHDIALIRLGRSVEYTEFIAPICLPLSEHLRGSAFEGYLMEISGWGQTEHSLTSNIKQRADVPVLPIGNCEGCYKLGNFSLESSSQICAGGQKGIDSCKGDSGGPLMGFDASNPKRHYYFVAGIVSFGPNPCGAENFPGVYTRVSHFVDWIQNNMEP